jgi:hypothetical protein
MGDLVRVDFESRARLGGIKSARAPIPESGYNDFIPLDVTPNAHVEFLEAYLDLLESHALSKRNEVRNDPTATRTAFEVKKPRLGERLGVSYVSQTEVSTETLVVDLGSKSSPFKTEGSRFRFTKQYGLEIIPQIYGPTKEPLKGISSLEIIQYAIRRAKEEKKKQVPDFARNIGQQLLLNIGSTHRFDQTEAFGGLWKAKDSSKK